jgi:GMP synthase (glutamine-hydrolysing)
MKQILKGEEILFVRNITRENPGLLEDIIKELGIRYTIIDLSLNQNIKTLESFGAVVVLGGPDSVNDESGKIKNLLDLVSRVSDMEIPFLGICLGLQALVKASGGKVVKSPTREVGLYDPAGKYFTVELTEKGRKDLLFQNLGKSFVVFQLHGETVVLAENMELLATGKYCRNQIVKAGPRCYGIQCHFELTTEMLQGWIKEDEDLKITDKGKLLADFQKIKDNYTQTGRQLFLNFLKIAGFL